ncbi:glycosyltransferase family 2 protein [Winogradskyella sp.]|uniref:glycosyltransferase family 2 protein n=1 Tax=Winogradskyella sp. TaxID=1883156 RepID=UPI0025DFB2B1|nr:glycosyltransferase family 2 protein [Winogradskyella sp.]
MKLSVIILNYNVRYFLELCLKSVEAAIQGVDAEIIVVDNNSPDDSCDMVKQLFPSVRLIENKENSGFSKGNNIGVAQAKGEYLCILNPDTVVAEDTFTKLIAFADTKDNLGIVGCQLIDGKGKFLPESKRNIPSPKVALKKLLGDDKSYYANQLAIDSIGNVEILVGAFMFVQKDVYEAVGGFDEDYFMYGEDIDLSYKVLKAGYSNMYFGETTIIHFKGESTLRDKKYAKRFYGAMQIFYKKHFKRNTIFNGLVWLGIKLAYGIRKDPINVNIKPYRSYVYSSGIDEALNVQLPEPTHLMTSILDEVKNDSMLVYDFNYMNTKDTIADLKQKSIQKNIVFRFLPKSSKFIIGSDSAINRGEVLHF